MPQLSARIMEATALDQTIRNDMFGLYDTYYHNPGPELFERDLSKKQFAILIEDDAGLLQGFTTLKVSALEIKGGSVRGIFSGDTIIRHTHWGEQSLAFAWIRLAGSIWAEQKSTPLYWFLIVKGHRTYRYLNVFSHRFYPAWRHATPAFDQAVMDGFAEQMFSTNHHPGVGILQFPESRGHLRERWADIPEHERQRPEVRFFLERNPGYTRGDELICLTELTPENLKPLARRIFLSGARQ